VNELILLWAKNQLDYPDWRSGQALFNSLHQLYPDIADKIRGTFCDPFYQNGRIAIALERILELLGE
jgi:hypothetical protein